MRCDRVHCPAVLRVPAEVLGVAGGNARERGAVDVVGMAGERRKSARDESLLQPVRGKRQVRQRAESAVALAVDAPGAGAERRADELRVGHDGISTEMLEVCSLCLGRSARGQRVPVKGGRQAGTALVQHQDPEVPGSRFAPTAQRSQPVAASARPALEEHQPGKLFGFSLGVGRRDVLTGEDGDGLRVAAPWSEVVQGNGEVVLGGAHATEFVPGLHKMRDRVRVCVV
ncbi:hypothetical protein AHiyo4_22800 [Arthrobacter sp. Hiyo4]|nr:hypothetical protein AHiyo4_22800 [Arthrobacter sp. Hiyo4]